MLDLAAIQARCEQATPGPWKRCVEGECGDEVCLDVYTDGGIIAEVSGDLDRAFIAHARSDVPALLAEVQRLRELVEAAYKEGCVDGFDEAHGHPAIIGWDASDAKRQVDEAP